jgi:nitroimidazol reductase NimA-like FMN-containing flavoprotein (pyridoxamine 5'-phosphate oxidase superfamily)
MSLTMSHEKREQFLADVHVGIVSIPRKDRGPLTVPIWYDYKPGGQVSMITNKSSIKGKLLLKTERISLCAQTETAPYCYVSVEGAFQITSPSEGVLLSMAIRYLGEAQGELYAASSGNGDDSMVVRFTPESWLSVDYSQS